MYADDIVVPSDIVFNVVDYTRVRLDKIPQILRALQVHCRRRIGSIRSMSKQIDVITNQKINFIKLIFLLC